MPVSRQQAVNAIERYDREIDSRLLSAQSTVTRLQAELAEAKAIRLAIIEEAMSEGGWSQAKVARSLGMTRQRVAQLRAAAEHRE